VTAAVFPSAAAMAMVPRQKMGDSKTPMGPFQKTVSAPAIAREYDATVLGPMSATARSFGTSNEGSSRASVETMVGAATQSTGSITRTPAASAFVRKVRAAAKLDASRRESPKDTPWDAM